MKLNLEKAIKKIGEEESLHTAKLFSSKNHAWNSSIETVFRACLKNPTLAPGNVKGKTPSEAIEAWVKKYWNGYDSRISKRESNPPGTIPDPMINTIIGNRLTHLTDNDLENIKYAHRISMSAENILGLLLEEFLALELEKFGWHCAWGETIKSVDFCHEDGRLLQVKNRSNSENSSSSRVREGTVIAKWFRVNANNGSYKWDELNKIYNTAIFSEQSFRRFVIQVIQANPGALAVEDSNPW